MSVMMQLVGGDGVELNAELVSALFADANAGTGKAVTVTGFRLVGGHWNNYQLLQPVDIKADIHKVLLKVIANDVQRPFGQDNPVFTVTYDGFIGQEGPGVLGGTLQFDTTAEKLSLPGQYTVTPYGLTSNNYTIQFVDGILTVLPVVPSQTIPAWLLEAYQAAKVNYYSTAPWTQWWSNLVADLIDVEDED